MKISNIARLGGLMEGCDCNDILQRLAALEEGGCDCGAIYERLTNIENRLTIAEENIMNIDVRVTNIESNVTNIHNDITTINQLILQLQDDVYLSDVIDYLSPQIRPIVGGANPLLGLGVSAIRIGNNYNFWGTGQLANITSLTLGATYYIVEAGQPSEVPPAKPTKIPELKWYQGEPTTGTVWIEDRNHTGGAMLVSMPLMFDETGIYFVATVPTGNLANLQPGATFKFTQSLILVNSSS